MNENKPSKRNYRRHDVEFKKAAVDLWVNSDRSAREVAKELDIHPWTLREWKSKLLPEPKEPQRPQSRLEMEEEMRRLRRENQSLRNQRDILKKTLHILGDSDRSNLL